MAAVIAGIDPLRTINALLTWILRSASGVNYPYEADCYVLIALAYIECTYFLCFFLAFVAAFLFLFLSFLYLSLANVVSFTLNFCF